MIFGRRTELMVRPTSEELVAGPRPVLVTSNAAPLAGDSDAHIWRARIASYNIHKCIGSDGRFRPDRTVDVIEEIGADILALQEVDQRFGDRAGLLDLDAIEQRCGLVPVPLARRPNSHGWYGNLLLVREGTRSIARQIVLPGAEPRGAIVIDLLLPGGPLRIIAAHLGLLRRSRARQVKSLMGAARFGQPLPVVIMGDLNEWRQGERSSLRALDPAFGPWRQMQPSFPARFPMLSLDRILASPRDMISEFIVHDTPLARAASDHLPVKAVLTLQPRLRAANRHD